MPSLRSAFFISMNTFSLSEFGTKSLIPSPINQMTASFSKDFRQGVDINLGVGYVNDETIPHEKLQQCLQYVLNYTELYKNALNYGSAEGSANLIHALRNYYRENNIGSIPPSLLEKKKFCIGANGATSILDAFAAIMPKGIVITTDPNYYIYTETLVRNGFTLCAIPEDSHGMRIDVLQEKLTEIDVTNISFVYIVTVNNPSSIILPNDRREAVVSIITDLSHRIGRKIPIIFDKAYEDIIFDTTVPSPVSGLVYDKQGLVIELGTLSKIIAPALRIGYAIGEDSELMQSLIQKTSDIGFSASLMNEEMAARFIDAYIVGHAREVQQGYRAKAIKLKELIDKHLGKYLSHYSGGQAGFYFYLTFANIETDVKSMFFQYLSRTTGNQEIDGNPTKNPRLIYVPGEFCVSDAAQQMGKYQLRISYGYEDISELERAVILMKDAVEYVLARR